MCSYTLLNILSLLVFTHLHVVASSMNQHQVFTAMSNRNRVVQATNKLHRVAAPEVTKNTEESEYIDIPKNHNVADVEREEDEAQKRLSKVILEAEELKKDLEQNYEASTSGKLHLPANESMEKMKMDLEKHYKIGASSPAASTIISPQSTEEEEDSITKAEDPTIELNRERTFPAKEDGVTRKGHKNDKEKGVDYMEKLRKREINWQRRKNEKVAATIAKATGKVEKPKTPFSDVEDFFKSLAESGNKNNNLPKKKMASHHH